MYTGMIDGLAYIVNELADERCGHVGTHRSEADIVNELLRVLFHKSVIVVKRHADRLEKVENEFLLSVHLGTGYVLPFRFQVGASRMIKGGFMNGLVGLDIMEVAQQRRDENTRTAVAPPAVDIYLFLVL